jgi:hypothetical protein
MFFALVVLLTSRLVFTHKAFQKSVLLKNEQNDIVLNVLPRVKKRENGRKL